MLLVEGESGVSKEGLFIFMKSPCRNQKLFKHSDCMVVVVVFY